MDTDNLAKIVQALDVSTADPDDCYDEYCNVLKDMAQC